MVLFESSSRQWRRWIGTRGVAFNVLRLCARRAYTVYELSAIKLCDVPGLSHTVSDVLSDINVSVIVGESERRELLAVVGTSPDPATSGGVTYLLRTTLLAFLVSPTLALAEPNAYRRYLQRWVTYPQTQERFILIARARFPRLAERELRALYEFVWRTALVFPTYLSTHWIVVAPGSGFQLGLNPTERMRVFGEFFLTDVRTPEESHPSVLKLFALGKGIPQHAHELLKWLSTADCFRLKEALRAAQPWPARRVLWEIKGVERRVRRVANEPPLNALWGAEEPPLSVMQLGRFGIAL